jgi:hypothetical protein
MFDPYASFRQADSYRPAPRGYYVVKQLLVWGGVAGLLVGLYRNDVFRDLARKAGQEQRYLAAEKLLVGSPGWGTPRSMEPVLAGASLPIPAPAERAPANEAVAQAPAPPAAPPPAAAAAAPASTALVPVPISALAPAVDPLKPVSLDSLPVAGSNTSRTISLDDPAPRAAAPAAAAPAPRAAANNKATKISLDAAPAPKIAKAPPKPAEPQRPKATEARPNDNPLTAAIRGAVRARPPSDAVPQ